MDQSQVPSGNMQSVDAILNEILQGVQPQGGSSSVTPSDVPTVAPVVEPTAAPQSFTNPSPAPVVTIPSMDVPPTVEPMQPVSASLPLSPEPSLAAAPPPAMTPAPLVEPVVSMGSGMAAMQAMSESPAAAQAESIPSVPQPPLAVAAEQPPVTAASILSGTTPVVTQQMPKYTAANGALGKKKAPLIAGLMVAVVLLGGVGAGVILSEQSQDVRQQAYVAPSRAPSAASAPSTNIAPEIPTVEESFQSLLTQYPNAQQIALSGTLSGTAYYAPDDIFGQQFFLQVNNLSAEPGKAYYAWVKADEKVFLIAQLMEGAQAGSGYASGAVPAGVTSGMILISQEDLSNETIGIVPTQVIQETAF